MGDGRHVGLRVEKARTGHLRFTGPVALPGHFTRSPLLRILLPDSAIDPGLDCQFT